MEDMSMSVTIINFSGRQSGNCQAIAKIALKQYSDRHLSYFDFSALDIAPCGRCGYECFTRRDACPYINDPVFGIWEAVTQSELALFIVPNYSDYPCANFFALNERSQCFFQGRPELLETYLRVQKRFIVVSNSRAENFIQAFRYHVAENAEPDILFLSASKYGRSSIQGDMMCSPEAIQALTDYLQ